MKLLKSIRTFFQYLALARQAGISARCGDAAGALRLMNGK
jgi:hypothetical protein